MLSTCTIASADPIEETSGDNLGVTKRKRSPEDDSKAHKGTLDVCTKAVYS